MERSDCDEHAHAHDDNECARARRNQSWLRLAHQERVSDSLSALEAFAVWLAVTGTSLLPWMLLIIPGFVFGRRAYRRYARHLPTAIVSPPARETSQP